MYRASNPDNPNNIPTGEIAKAEQAVPLLTMPVDVSLHNLAI